MNMASTRGERREGASHSRPGHVRAEPEERGAFRVSRGAVPNLVESCVWHCDPRSLPDWVGTARHAASPAKSACGQPCSKYLKTLCFRAILYSVGEGPMVESEIFITLCDS